MLNTILSEFDLSKADIVLQRLKEKARDEDRRADAQRYADVQGLIRKDVKPNSAICVKENDEGMGS